MAAIDKIYANSFEKYKLFLLKGDKDGFKSIL